MPISVRPSCAAPSAAPSGEPRTPALTAALVDEAAASAWRRFEECRDAGRDGEGELFRDQACWRARLAARLRAAEWAALAVGSLA